MKKLYKRILAITLTLAMVVSSIAFYHAKVSAAELTQDQIDSISGNGGSMTNMVLGSTATAYPGVAEGNLNNLTNGSLTNGHCALSSGWGYSGEAYAILDLGDYYWANSLDEIVLTYKDVASNDTVVGRTYNIQYSVDLINWETMYTSDTITEADLLPNEDNIGRATVDVVSGYTGKVRYIKIDYPSLPTYGIQLREIAVLATSPQIAPMDTCDDPDSVTAVASGIGQVAFSITSGEGQEGYIYSAYLDNAHGQLLNSNCQPDTTYTYDIPGGNHTVFVQSHYNGAVSPGINSNQFSVNTYETKVTDSDWNFAYNRPYTLDSGTSQEGSGSLTDGLISNNSYVTPTKGQAGSWAYVELNSSWKASSFETLVVWFRSLVGGTFPENGGLKFQYSVDGTEWRDAAVLTQDDINVQRASTAPFAIKADVSSVTGAVKYVRVYFPNAVAYGAQMTELGVYDIYGDAEEAQSETVVDPANFTSTSNSPNTISGNITAPSGHSDYTYNIYLNGSTDPYVEGLSAGNYTLTCIDAGTYSVTVKSEHNGFHSPGLTINNVTVASGFTYSTTFGKGLFPESDANGLNYISQDGKTVPGVSATASIGSAMSAVDTNAGTRWGSEGGDGDPQWITVDLGSVKSIKEIGIWWETASSKDFVISASTDGTTFQDISYKNGASAGADRRDTFVLTNTVNARYIKIFGKNRTTGYGHSIWEIAVYGPTPTHTVTIDGNEMATVFEGSEYTFPGPGEEGNTPYGYYLTSDPSKVYAPRDTVTVNSDLVFTGLATVAVDHTNGATIHMVKSEPGIAFRATAQMNGGAPIFNSAFTYGMVITTYDLFTEEYEENLEIDNSRNQVHVNLSNSSQMSSGTYTVGVLNIKQENLTRDFVARGYVKINYVDGDSMVVYASNPTTDVRRRNISQIARSMKAATSYYDSLEEPEKQAVDYFATFE